MKKFNTHHFGEITYDPANIIRFPQGLPGFPEDINFLFMSESDDEDMFFWLQSLDNGEVAFTLMDVYRVLPNYDPQIDDYESEELGTIEEDSLEIYNIVVIPEDARQMRVNLKAPVVINNATGIGRQVICINEEYQLRYMIFEELEKKQVKD